MMEELVVNTFESAQWVAVWVSMLFTALSFVISVMNPDWRKKRLLRDIQIFNGVKDYADPYSLSILREKIENALAEECKLRIFGTSMYVYYTFYFVVTVCIMVWSISTRAYVSLAANAIGMIIVIGLVVAGRIKVARVWKDAKKRADEYAESLSTGAKPSIKIIAKAIRRGMSEDEITSALFAEERAAKLYASKFAHDPVQKRYIEQAVVSAANDLAFEAAAELNGDTGADVTITDTDVSTANTGCPNSTKEGTNLGSNHQPEAVEPDIKTAFLSVPHKGGDLSEREMRFFDEMDGYMAKLIPIVWDMYEAVVQRSYTEYQAQCFLDYLELVPLIKDCLLRFDSYLEPHLKKLFNNVLTKMQDSSGFWVEQADKLARGNDSVDEKEAESLCETLLLDIATARVAQSRNIA